MDQVIELRQYTVEAAHRDDLITMFHTDLTPGQQASGINVHGVFADADRDDRIIWWRSFLELTTRPDALRAFYRSDVWAASGEAFNAPLRDYSNAMMLEWFAGVQSLDQLQVATPITVVPVEQHQAHSVAANLCSSLPDETTIFTTLHADNEYPRLPVRDDTNIVIVGRPPGLERPHTTIRPQLAGSAAAELQS